VLVLYQQLAETQPMREFTQRLRLTIQRELGAPVEFYQEALDFDRFSGREHSSPLAAYFADKYRGLRIDVVVPVGGRALTFAVDQLRGVLPHVPVVFALCASPQTNPASLPANVTGRIASASRFVPTVWMARRLQPDAKRVVVIGGAGASDSVAVSAAASAVSTLGDSVKLTIVQGLSLDALLPTLRQLPRHAIVIFANYRQDGHGQAFEPLDVVGSIARAASGPMYTQLRSYVGEGVVGGSVTRFDDEGVRTGRLVMRVLRRRPGERLPPVEPIANSFVADWRQLQRWGLFENRLPPGTDLVFREPTLWQRYRTFILLALVVSSAELLLIATLLLERRRRKRAQLVAEQQQRRLEETRRQVADMGRLALVGEFAATISHELRQPLAAIRANAETGARFVTRDPAQFGAADREVCGEIFHEIVADNELAAAIITRVRALVRGEEFPPRLVDLNEICRISARLLQHDARTRQAEIILSLDPGLPAIVGDSIQLQQVLLNLLWNALDAVAASTNPKIVISTLGRGEEVEVSVLDNGPGLAADVQQHLFESFFTTKPQGLGLGLVIVQSIVERHRGRVRADNDGQGGAIFRVVLPLKRSTPIRPSEASLTHLDTERSTSS
jgi:signal transduction histidine kinase